MKYDAFGFLPKIHFFIFLKKNSFICLVLSSKYPHLRLDKFTKLWALEHNDFLTHSADHWTFLLVPKRDMASRLCFFSQISWLVPIFQTCEANFSKPRTDTDTIFSLKIPQDPRLQFRWKKFSKNFAFMGFLKEFLKKRFFRLFFIFDPLNLRSETKYRVLGFVNCTSVLYATLWTKNDVNFVSYLVFLGKKEDKKFKKILILGSYFSKLIKDTETVLFREEQQRYRLLFRSTKLPSSSMTPSFFCQKNLNYFQKKLLVLFYLSSCIWPRPNMGLMVSLVLRGLCRLRFRLNVMSKFVSLWIF